MEKIFHHSFYNELRVCPEEHPVLITEPPLNPRNNREKLVSIMYETHHIPYCVSRREFGGMDITRYLMTLLGESGLHRRYAGRSSIVSDIKEKLCYVAHDYESELEDQERRGHCNHAYELPDGSTFTVGAERFRAPELLFRPGLLNEDGPSSGIHDAVTETIIRNCDPDLRRRFYRNIVLAGGSSMFEGLVERLNDELWKGVDAGKLRGVRVRVNAPADRAFSSWIGGSILSSLSTFQDCWISKEEYADAGAGIVHRKCTVYVLIAFGLFKKKRM